ncbi:NUDIX domain-containing protein [Sutcliffiella sp. NPDC057660]
MQTREEWDFPGGHIEIEETPEECLKHGAYEVTLYEAAIC